MDNNGALEECENTLKLVNVVLAAISVAFTTLTVIGLIEKPGSVYEFEPEEQNPFKNKRVRFVEDGNDDINADGARGYLEIVSDVHTPRRRSFYERCVKRCIDIILSGFGLILLSPVFVVISVLVYMDDPGPVLFTQKRVGKNKAFFRLHKFRSMKMNTPANTPTHMLENPDEYITRVGRALRKTSLDELPQVWDIWMGNMSIIGPRPALWNQDKLVALRDGYTVSDEGRGVEIVDANSVTPGLTGLAQISGRDELELNEKAALDREYVEKMSFIMDLKCFMGTITSVLGHKGVVEGGTGNMKESKIR